MSGKRTDRDDGPEREALRARLSEWEVPAIPPELEEDLRRTFRQRHGPRRRIWVPLAAALAAGLAALALWHAERSSRPAAPLPAEPPRSATTPQRPPAPLPAPDGLARATAGSAPASSRPRRASPRGHENAVIVEPAQRELLGALAASLADPQPPSTVLSGAPVDVMRAGTPEAPIPRLVPTDPPRYRSDWKKVAGAWPVLQLPTPTIQR